MEFSNYKVIDIFENKTVNDFLLYYKLAKQKIAQIKEIQINNNKASLKSILHEFDTLSISYDEEIDFLPLNKPISILYEDDYLLIINKPANILVHPDDKSKNGTLTNMVAAYFYKINLHRNVRYLHRLDIETTGLIIYAKDNLTASYYNYLISDHSIARIYLAIASGLLPNKKGVINEPIGEDRHHNQRRRVSKTGKEAITNYEVIKEIKGNSLVKLELKTGRTHQIRVHMKYIGHPLLGDVLYGGSNKRMKRVALHSYILNLPLPYSKLYMEIKAPIPSDMEDIINSD